MKEIKSKRGWEKTASTASTFGKQGGWATRNLVVWLATRDFKLQEAILYSLAALAKDNSPVAAILAKSSSERDGMVILSHQGHPLATSESPLSIALALTKSRSTEVQLAAALWYVIIFLQNLSQFLISVTHILRGCPHTDESAARTIINVVNQVISNGSCTIQARTKACFILCNPSFSL